MPTYDYACTHCDHAFEVVQAFTDDALTECPQCQGRLRKVFGNVGVVFKGSGFYRNDSRSGTSSPGTSSPGTSGSSGSPGSSSDAKGDSSVKPSSDAASTSSRSTSSRSTSSGSTSSGPGNGKTGKTSAA